MTEGGSLFSSLMPIAGVSVFVGDGGYDDFFTTNEVREIIGENGTVYSAIATIPLPMNKWILCDVSNDRFDLGPKPSA